MGESEKKKYKWFATDKKKRKETSGEERGIPRKEAVQ